VKYLVKGRWLKSHNLTEMFDAFKIRSIRTAENDFVAPGIPPQKPTDIMLKIGRELISVMDNNHCTYVNN